MNTFAAPTAHSTPPPAAPPLGGWGVRLADGSLELLHTTVQLPGRIRRTATPPPVSTIPTSTEE
jgi:hypothetical protein